MGLTTFRRSRQMLQQNKVSSGDPAVPRAISPLPYQPNSILLSRFHEQVGSPLSVSGWALPLRLSRCSEESPYPASAQSMPLTPTSDHNGFEIAPLNLRGGAMYGFEDCDPNDPDALERYLRWTEGEDYHPDTYLDEIADSEVEMADADHENRYDAKSLDIDETISMETYARHVQARIQSWADYIPNPGDMATVSVMRDQLLRLDACILYEGDSSTESDSDDGECGFPYDANFKFFQEAGDSLCRAKIEDEDIAPDVIPAHIRDIKASNSRRQSSNSGTWVFAMDPSVISESNYDSDDETDDEDLVDVRDLNESQYRQIYSPIGPPEFTEADEYPCTYGELPIPHLRSTWPSYPATANPPSSSSPCSCGCGMERIPHTEHGSSEEISPRSAPREHYEWESQEDMSHHQGEQYLSNIDYNDYGEQDISKTEQKDDLLDYECYMEGTHEPIDGSWHQYDYIPDPYVLQPRGYPIGNSSPQQIESCFLDADAALASPFSGAVGAADLARYNPTIWGRYQERPAAQHTGSHYVFGTNASFAFTFVPPIVSNPPCPSFHYVFGQDAPFDFTFRQPADQSGFSFVLGRHMSYPEAYRFDFPWHLTN